MAIIPVRGLAQGGIILDQHPTSLPLPAFTGGRNVVFDNGKCSRSPIWRLVQGDLGSSSPVRFCASRSPASGFNEVIVARDDASLARIHDGAITEASEVGFVPRDYYDLPWSGGSLGDVVYINRPDGPPRSLKPLDNVFEVLPHWPTGWTCRVLRPFRDSLVALGITKTGVDYPSTVDVSDVAYYQTVPGTWDSTDPSTLAYESPLARLTGPIVDGMELGNAFIVYTADQCVEMVADSNYVYAFQDLPFTDGVISTNCVVEIDGLHYVFGSRDIYTTNGQTKTSLAESKVKDALYRRIDMSKRSRCFVQFDPVRNKVVFAYVSSDSSAVWTGPTGCNEAMVYDRSSSTWTIIDLPNTMAMTIADVNTAITWDQMSFSWNDFGGSWYDQEDGRNRHLLSVSAPLPSKITTNKLLAYDFIDRGRLALTVDTEALAPSFADRTGIALDADQEAGVPLRTSKLLRGVTPEIECSRPTGVVMLYCSAVATPFAPVPYPAMGVPFMPSQDYVLDCMVEGRYLAMRVRFPDDCDTDFSGLDLDVITNGRR